MGQHPETDDGRRLADAHNAALAGGGRGRWIAARLSDGGTDGVIYDVRADAVRHQIHETQCAYIRVHPSRMEPAEGTAILRVHREAYDAGYRMVDPADSPLMASRGPVITPNRAQRRAMMRGNRGRR